LIFHILIGLYLPYRIFFEMVFLNNRPGLFSSAAPLADTPTDIFIDNLNTSIH